MLLQDWVATWQPLVVGLRPSSLARDDAYIRTHILPRFGTTPIGAITTLDVRGWVAELSAAGRAPATVHKAYQTLSKVLRAAVDNDLLAISPCRRTPLPRIDRQEMRYLDPAEVARLADSMAARYRAFVVFDAYCGLRLSELAGLRRRHIDLIERRVRVTENAVEVKGRIEWGQPKTRAGRRTVPMTVKVSAALAQHLDEFVGPDPDSLVFGGADGGVLRAGSFRSRFWVPATKKADLVGLRIHDLRHTAVALWKVSPPAPTRSSSPPGPGTRRSPSSSTATGISLKVTTSTSSTDSTSWPPIAAQRLVPRVHRRSRQQPLYGLELARPRSLIISVPKFPSMKARELRRVLQRPPLSYRTGTSRGGSHVWLEAQGRPRLRFAFHDGATVPPGLVRDILVRQVGLTEAEAIDVLH